MSAHLKTTTASWRVDETYVKIKGTWMYLYRAVDSNGDTLEFLRSRDTGCRGSEALFLESSRRLPHHYSPRDHRG